MHEKRRPGDWGAGPANGGVNEDFDWDQVQVADHGRKARAVEKSGRGESVMGAEVNGPRGGPSRRYGTKNRWTVVEILWTLAHARHLSFTYSGSRTDALRISRDRDTSNSDHTCYENNPYFCEDVSQHWLSLSSPHPPPISPHRLNPFSAIFIFRDSYRV